MDFRYFRKEKTNKDHTGVVSVGYEYATNEEGQGKIQYAIALCSPKDCFSRQVARAVIDNRFDNGFIAEIVISPFDPKMIVDLIIAHYNSKIASAESYGIKPYNDGGKADFPKFAYRISF
jgi:hypothetical protein